MTTTTTTIEDRNDRINAMIDAGITSDHYRAQMEYARWMTERHGSLSVESQRAHDRASEMHDALRILSTGN